MILDKIVETKNEEVARLKRRRRLSVFAMQLQGCRPAGISVKLSADETAPSSPK